MATKNTADDAMTSPGDEVPEPTPEPTDAPAMEPQPVADTETPETPAPPRPEVILVDAPVPPRKKGNRGLGIALALLATGIYLALLVVADIVITVVASGAVDSAFLTEPGFYFPAIFFFIGLVLVVLVLNRAGWWTHIIGSVVVAVIVYFGTAGLILLAEGVLTMTQSEANAVYFAALADPRVIVAALLAREVSIWTGAILARRGRGLRVRNAEAYAAYEKEKAELIPTA